MFRPLLAALAAVTTLMTSPGAVADTTLASRLHAVAPDASPEVLTLAANAMTCALAHGMAPANRLLVPPLHRPYSIATAATRMANIATPHSLIVGTGIDEMETVKLAAARTTFVMNRTV